MVQELSDALKEVRYSAAAENTIQTGHNAYWNNEKILASNSKETNLYYSEFLKVYQFENKNLV